MTKLSFEETLIEVWRQALVENAKAVKVGGESYPVRQTPKRGLRQVDFTFDGDEIRGLEQNPETKSRWARLAQSGKKSYAIPQRRPIRGERSGWEGDSLRQSTVIFIFQVLWRRVARFASCRAGRDMTFSANAWPLTLRTEKITFCPGSRT
jgi:hypothetical protein